MQTPVQYPLTIYYDASCPLCAAEMHTIKESDFSNQLILVDCSSNVFDAPPSCPVTKAAMMERIQAQDASGRWLSGVDVFAAAYAGAGFSKLGKFWGNEKLRPLLSRAYPLIADNRHWLSKTPLPYVFNYLLRLTAPNKT